MMLRVRLLALLLAGCVTTREPRFEAGAPNTAGAAAVPAVERALRQLVDDDRTAILACFDGLGARLASEAPLKVAMAFSVVDSVVTLDRVQPLDRKTVVDAGLMPCLQERAALWRLAGQAGRATLPLQAVPRLPSEQLHPKLAAGPQFHPEE